MSPSVRFALRVTAVLAILFVVAAVLFPMFAKCRGCGSHHSVCASNEKQLGLALEQYANDNDGMMPDFSDGHGGTWRTALFAYTKSPQVFQCPNRDTKDHDANPVGFDGFAQSYAANSSVYGAFVGPGSRPILVKDVETPNQVITVMEAAYNPFPQYDIDDPESDSPSSRRFWAGHEGRSSLLFLDGHVKSLRPLDTYQDTDGKARQNLWYRDGTKPLSANGVAVLQDAQKRFGG